MIVATVPMAACGVDAGASAPALEVQAVVYGEDDRQDLYEARQPFVRLARENAIALIAPDQLEPEGDGSYAILAPTYAEVQSLCPGERFSGQVAAANCSGVLVAPDIVATASHCLAASEDGSPDCSRSRYVRGYALTEAGAAPLVPAAEVFDCAGVLGKVRAPAGASCHYDVALVRLAREAPTTQSIVLRNQAVEAEDPVVVIGFPAGLPVKIDEGARVVDAREATGDSFTLSSDTFAVSSGSGVFDRSGKLVGLFTRGRPDYETADGCQRVRREPEYAAEGYEEATQIGVVRRMLTALARGEPIENVDLFPDVDACFTPTPAAATGVAAHDVGANPRASDSGHMEAQGSGPRCGLGPSAPSSPSGGAHASGLLLAILSVLRRRVPLRSSFVRHVPNQSEWRRVK